MKTEILKPTKDNWHPSLPGNFVSVKLRGNNDTTKKGFAISVWGDDDFGLEKVFSDKTEARRVFRLISEMKVVNIADLRKLGFTDA